jgi:small subunit ribosomal protein S6
MRIYELVVVMRPSLKDPDKKKLLVTLKGWLKDVKILKEDDWGQKPLAYIIKKEAAGLYYFFQLETENSIALDLEQKIYRNDNIIRHLLLRTK